MMDTNVSQHTHLRLMGRALLKWGGIAVLLVLGIQLLLKAVVATPWAAARTARVLTGFLHQSVTVSGLAIDGATIVADGVAIANPAGFAGGELVRCRVLRIAPVWGEILAGRRSFALIELRGLSVTVSRNHTGVWNFGELAKRLAAGKSPAETFVKRFVLEGASFTIADRRMEGISLTVRDLATKGSTSSRLFLTCRDMNNNVYRLEGEARLGAAPTADLSLSAPSLSLQGLDRLVRLRLPFATDTGSGKLFLAARFAGERLETRGNLGWNGVVADVPGGRIPLRGTLDFSGSYDTKRDVAALDNVSLNVNDLVRVQGRASAQQVRGECAFAGEVTGDGMELNDFHGFLPERLRRGLTFRGTVVPGTFRFAGDRRHGVTAGSGTLILRQGELARAGRLLLAGVGGEVSLTRVQHNWLLQGRFTRRGKPDGVPLQELLLPFSARLSSRFRPFTADVGPFAAKVAGIPLEGGISYRSAASEPLAVRLEVPRLEVAMLNERLASRNITLTAGTAMASFRGKGRLSGGFEGEARVALAGLTGTTGGRPLSLGKAAVQSTVSFVAGKLTAVGTARIAGGAVGGKGIEGGFGYRVADRKIILADGSGTIGKTAVHFAAIRSAIPAARPSPGGERLPLRLEFDGVDVGQGEMLARGMTGSLTADLVSVGKGRWLEGTGTVAAPRLIFGNREMGALGSRLVFNKGEMAAVVSGKALDGNLQGTANIDPFAKEPLVRFSLGLEGGKCALLAGVAYRGEAAQPTGGTLDTQIAGSYSRKDGLRCRLTAAGRDVVLTGKGGRTLLADGRFGFSGEMADGNLAVREGIVGVGHDLVLKFQGQVARAAASDRQGHLVFSLPAAPLSSLLSSFANLLPRPLQEATARGVLKGEAGVRLAGRDIGFDGSVTVADGALEVPGQKLGITGIGGTIPFSLDLAGGGAGRPPATPGAARNDYTRLLQDLRQAKEQGDLFRIGTIRFGAVECGAASIVVRAGNGLTEITSLKAELYGGQLLGKGFVGYRHGVMYGGNILVNDMSLKMFCDAYPAIKGYITGRLDGIMAFHREGPGLQGVAGAIDLWTHVGDHEKMLVSKEFLQKLAGKKLKGIFFRNDRSYDRGEISATLENGYLTFDLLDIEHTNFFGVKDLSVTVVPVQNRIAVDHLFAAIREAAARGKAVKGGEAPAEEAPPATEFKWEE
jgi:hypothetical protein